MSEVLAQLEKKGSGLLIPTTPDTIYVNDNMGNNATATLAVTKKPKCLITCFIRLGVNCDYFVGVLDVENNIAYRYGFIDNADRNEIWTNWQNYITSITDSAVEIKNRYGAVCNVRIGAYY